jgi:hypothetical protein
LKDGVSSCKNAIVCGGRGSASSSGVAEVCCERTYKVVDDGEGEEEGEAWERWVRLKMRRVEGKVVKRLRGRGGRSEEGPEDV